MNNRTFTDKPAKRESTPVLIGIMGPSGGGKTYSALRLATGIQSVFGGDIGFIDTEARRALHYAEKFKFRHIDFKAPFGPLDYLAAIEHFYKQGIKTIIVDSMSHEHEGEGGVLDQHEIGMGGNEAKSMLAWKKPKMERRRLINSILQMPVNFIFCFRAKEKIKLTRNQNGKMEPKNQGFMPIAGEEFLFEMTVNCLLLPKANGIPEWNPVESGERMMTKLPEQFKALFANPKPLDEATGKMLAEWSKGGVARTPDIQTQNGASIHAEGTEEYNQSNAHVRKGVCENEAKRRAASFDSFNNSESGSSEDLSSPPAGFESFDYEQPAYSQESEKTAEKVQNAVAGALVVQGEITQCWEPKSDKAPWNIVIGGVKMAVWKRTLPDVVKAFESKRPFKGIQFEASYTSEQKGQYTNNTLVSLTKI